MFPKNIFLVLIVLLCVSLAPVVAQDDTCPALVSDAMETVGSACADLGRNQACYGHNQVSITRFDTLPVENFATIGDTIDVTQLASLTTAPLDVTENVWGIAMLALQANLPDTLPGQNVTFLVYGDAELVSEVPPESQGAPPSFAAEVTSGVNVRSGPGTDYRIIGALPAGEKVRVTGRSASGDWMQIDFDGASAWISSPLLAITGEVSLLPVLGANERAGAAYTAPMQAFRFTSGVGESVCEEVPRDGLLVQAPKNTIVHFLVNGVQLEVGSTALLYVADDQLSVNTFDGFVNVTSANETQPAKPGFQVVASANTPPTEPEPYDYATVRTAPVELLPEPVSVPVVVPGNSDWVDSGIAVTAGQPFTLTAGGTVNVWDACETERVEKDLADMVCSSLFFGPEGGAPRFSNGQFFDMSGLMNMFPMPDAVPHSLIGRIGGEMFSIGGGGTFTASADGTLQFRINDADYNNEGAFTVVVELSQTK